MVLATTTADLGREPDLDAVCPLVQSWVPYLRTVGAGTATLEPLMPPATMGLISERLRLLTERLERMISQDIQYALADTTMGVDIPTMSESWPSDAFDSDFVLQMPQLFSPTRVRARLVQQPIRPFDSED